jgi:hypothetical protein
MAKRTRKTARARTKPVHRAAKARARRDPARQSAGKRTAARAAKPVGQTAANGGLFADLKATPANFASLTPISFLKRSAETHPTRVAIIHLPRPSRPLQGAEDPRVRTLADHRDRQGAEIHPARTGAGVVGRDLP